VWVWQKVAYWFCVLIYVVWRRDLTLPYEIFLTEELLLLSANAVILIS